MKGRDDEKVWKKKKIDEVLGRSKNPRLAGSGRNREGGNCVEKRGIQGYPA